MPKGLCGRTSSLRLGFLIPSSQTTDFSMIARLSEDIVMSWVSRIGIPLQLGITAYPSGNGQVDAVNKIIVNRLKKRLDNEKGKWVEELPYVL